ncbi:Cysteine desulfuration protein SufE [compost metagenome]
MVFFGDSDALIVKGLVGLLLKVYNESTPSEVLATPPEFLKALGFEGNLSPSRANGLHSMLKQIKHYATAFDYMLKMKK